MSGLPEGRRGWMIYEHTAQSGRTSPFAILTLSPLNFLTMKPSKRSL